MREVLGAVIGLLFALGALADGSAAFTADVYRPVSAAQSLGGRLDLAHDWLYRRLERLIEEFDTRFAASDREPIAVPATPLRLGFEGQALHRADGTAVTGFSELEASLQLPNLQRRFRLFISSTDLPESPGGAAAGGNPLRAGVRYLPHVHLNFDIGVQVKLKPVAFAALKWAPEFTTRAVHAFPLMKLYVESGLGLGVSAGLALDHRQNAWMVRSASYADWRRSTSATSWTQSFLFGNARALIVDGPYNQMSTGHDLACGVLALLSISGDRLSRTSTYEAGVLFKRPLRAGWLFGYVEPVVRWERDSRWHPDAGVRAGLDALFWGPAAAPNELTNRCL
jgi:hypothetical protein